MLRRQGLDPKVNGKDGAFTSEQLIRGARDYARMAAGPSPLEFDHYRADLQKQGVANPSAEHVREWWAIKTFNIRKD